MYGSTPIRQSSLVPLCAADLSSVFCHYEHFFYRLKTTFNPFAASPQCVFADAIVEWQIEPINLPSGSVALAVIKQGQNGVRREEALIIE